MRVDKDIKEMSFAERGQKLQRLRNLIRTHKAREGNARCWHADLDLYATTLPERSIHAGKMNGEEEVLLQNCKRYIRRQQCVLHGCTKEVR